MKAPYNHSKTEVIYGKKIFLNGYVVSLFTNFIRIPLLPLPTLFQLVGNPG